jgi:ribonucleoside-diphosphate reductase alpha chain
MLYKLKIPYNSEDALQLADEIMFEIHTLAYDMSQELGKRRGKILKSYRNATLLTIAPTGTISMIADCSSGIEPAYSLAYEKHVMDNNKLKYTNTIFEEHLKNTKQYSPVIIDDIVKNGGSIQNIDSIPNEDKEVFVTAQDISPEWHIKMQAIFQKYVCNSVSKTINLPNSATIEDIKQAYLLAYELKCKGITVYRDGSREGQVYVTTKSYNSEVKDNGNGDDTVSSDVCVVNSVFSDAIQTIKPRQRESALWGTTEKVKTGCGNLYITINSDKKGICEVFTATGKSGGCPSQSEALSRLISLYSRCGLDIKHIIKQLKGIRCPAAIKRGVSVLSCPDAIGRALEYKIEIEEKIQDTFNTIDYCPDCKSKLTHESGCVICKECGYSKCG